MRNVVFLTGKSIRDNYTLHSFLLCEQMERAYFEAIFQYLLKILDAISLSLYRAAVSLI